MRFLLISLLIYNGFLCLAKNHLDLIPGESIPAINLIIDKATPIYVTASTVKLHRDRSTNAVILIEIPKGANVKVIDSRFGNWWQIEYKGKIGYAQNTYLKYSSVNNKLEDDPIYNLSSIYNSKPTYQLNSNLDLYEHPSASSAIVTKLPKGVKIKVIDSSNGSWWLVHYKGRTGNIRNLDLNYSEQKQQQQGPAIPVTKLSLVPKPKPTHTTTSVLSMRESMSHGSVILLEVPKGASIEVINPNFGDWAQIRYEGKVGYVTSGFFTGLNNNVSDETLVASALTTAKPDKISTVKGTEDAQRNYALIEETSLRAAPDSQARVLKRFVVGDRVTVLDKTGEWWWEVDFDGKRGWVKRRLLEAH